MKIRRLKLIHQWKRCLRMISVQAMLVAGAIQGAWVVIPADLKIGIGDEWLRYITIALMFFGVIGRLVVQPGLSGGGYE